MDEGTSLVCDACGAEGVARYEVEESFTYGTESNAVELKATVPVESCSECGLELTGSEAEDRRHEAVCRHLGVLTPTEIKRIRSRLELSQEGLAELTGIGVASVARWESGAVIQTSGYDRYLRLLGWTDVVSRLRAMGDETGTLGPVYTRRGAERSFPSIQVGSAAERAASRFQLQRVG